MLHCNVGKTLGLKEPLQMIQGATVILIVLVKNWIFICFLFTAPFTPPPHSPHHSPQKSGCTDAHVLLVIQDRYVQIIRC
jgi:hypothetical protein